MWIKIKENKISEYNYFKYTQITGIFQGIFQGMYGPIPKILLYNYICYLKRKFKRKEQERNVYFRPIYLICG